MTNPQRVTTHLCSSAQARRAFYHLLAFDFIFLTHSCRSRQPCFKPKQAAASAKDYTLIYTQPAQQLTAENYVEC